MINGRLIFYAPFGLWVDEASPQRSLPALRRWTIGRGAGRKAAGEGPATAAGSEDGRSTPEPLRPRMTT